MILVSLSDLLNTLHLLSLIIVVAVFLQLVT